MKRLLVILGLLVSGLTWAAQDADYASILREKGHKHCSPAINNLASWLLGQDGQTIGLWMPKSPDEHAVILTGSKRYSDGNSMVLITATPTKGGGCDLIFSVTLPLHESCASFRETKLKDWKYFADIAGLSVYEDPTASSINAVLQPFGGECIMLKTGLLSFSEDVLKELSGGKAGAPEGK